MEIAVHTTQRNPPISVPPGRPVSVLADQMPPGALRHLAPKEHLFIEGDKKVCVFQVVSGTLALYKMLRDGRRQVFRFASAGDVVALSFAAVEMTSAQATTHTLVKCIPFSAVARAAEQSPRFARLMCESLAAEMDGMCDHLVSLGQNGAEARVARFLLNLAEKAEAEQGDGRVVHLPMTRADIGDFLGLTLESVSRALSALKAQRVIGIERVTIIHIRRRDQLELAAEGGEEL